MMHFLKKMLQAEHHFFHSRHVKMYGCRDIADHEHDMRVECHAVLVITTIPMY